MTQTHKVIIVPALVGLMVLGGAIVGYAQSSRASNDDANTGIMGMGRNMVNSARGMMGGFGDGVHGTITAINGTTLTVVDREGKSYTVDTSNATVHTKKERGAEEKDADVNTLTVNEVIGVHGTVDGTNIIATDIMSGVRGHDREGIRGGRGVMGEVTKIDGNTITVEGRNGESYTVNAGDAKVFRTVEGSVGDIKEGSRIGVHGDRNGTTVTAERIMADLPEAPEKN